MGYRETLRQHHLPLLPERVFESVDDKGDIFLDASRLETSLAQMDGLFVFNDYIAYKLIQLCHKQGIAIPQDLRMIGYGNDAFGAYTYPSLSTVDQPAFEMGAVAARMLLNQIYSDPSHFEAQTQVLPTRLILRQSTQG